MHLGEQPFFRLYTHFVLIIIGRDLGRIHNNIIIVFVGLLYIYIYTHHCGVHFFVTSRYDFAVKRFCVFDTHRFCGSITWKWGNKSIRNLTQKTPRGAPGTRAAEYNHLCRYYIHVYIQFTSANFYHIIIVIMRKPIDWRRKENRRW